MSGRSAYAIRAAVGCVGGITGFLIACYLGVYEGPPTDDFETRLFSGKFDFARLVLGIGTGAVLGYLVGRDIVRGWAARPAGQSWHPWDPLTMVGAVAWIALASLIGVAAGSEVAHVIPPESAARPQSSNAPFVEMLQGLSDDFNAYFRRERFRSWGALVGALAGYGLLRWAWAVRARPLGRPEPSAMTAALVAENARLRDEMARLREGRA